MATANYKDHRLVARVSTDVHQFIKSAAELSGASVSQFLVEAVLEKAQQVAERNRVIRLSLQGADTIFSALENPGTPNKKLATAAKRYKEAHIHEAVDRGNRKAP